MDINCLFQQFDYFVFWQLGILRRLSWGLEMGTNGEGGLKIGELAITTTLMMKKKIIHVEYFFSS